MRRSNRGIENLEKRYGETVALTGANVDFRYGVHTILGENGSGKSTMLKILSGVVAPTQGRVVLNDKAIAANSPADMKALGLATVFQEVLIAPHRSVVENIFLGFDGLLTRKVSKVVREKASQAVLSRIARFQLIFMRLLAACRLPLNSWSSLRALSSAVLRSCFWMKPQLRLIMLIAIWF